MQSSLATILLTIIAIAVVIAILWVILSYLYQRTTTELSLVRTGFLGEKVAISGGAFVIPVLHEVARINMGTMRISLSHFDQDALITQDRLRVNVQADFYVRVTPQKQAVAAAARTLGRKTQSLDEMRQLFEARFNDALRTAAAERSMEDLHENRGAYATRVRELASLGLDASGLEIDSVSLSKLDQASREFFNPNNAFDAAGLTKLTAEIEERRKKRNEIERDSQVAIQRKNLASEQQILELQREEEYARLQQERDIAIRSAEQQSQIAVERAEMQRCSQVAEVGSQEAVEKARLTSERVLKEQRISLDQQVKSIEIARSQETELAETARRKALEIAQQKIEIEIAEHAQRRDAALAQADLVRAQRAKAEESVISAREQERAEREKALALIAATRETEAKGIAIVKEAEAKKAAAERYSETVRINAEAEAFADSLRRQSKAQRYAIKAEGRRNLNEAENLMSAEAMQLRARLAALDRVKAVVRESAKPLKHISDIKILHIDGLSAGGSGSANEPAPEQSLSDQVMSSALKYRLQAPLLSSLLESAGIHPHDVASTLAFSGHDTDKPGTGQKGTPSSEQE